jgi:Flp pilus assembly protein TadB
MNFSLVILSSFLLALGTFLGVWIFLRLSALPVDNDPTVYTRERYLRLRDTYPPFRYLFALVLEWVPYSVASSQFESIRRNLPMGDKGSPWKPEEFLAQVRVEGVFLAVTVGIVLALLLHPAIGLVCTPFVCIFYSPMRIKHLAESAEKRRVKIRQRLPGLIDLLALAQEAGASFDGSLRTAVKENKGHPIAIEFQEMLRHIELGRPLQSALRDLAERVQDEPIHELVSTITKAMDLGVPMANTLTGISEQMRLKLQQWGEKAAGEAQVKIMFPSIVIMVACMIIIVAPFILPAIFNESM